MYVKEAESVCDSHIATEWSVSNSLQWSENKEDSDVIVLNSTPISKSP